MGELVQRLDARIREALKAGRAEELGALRLVKAELSTRRVELKVAEVTALSDEVVVEVLRSMVKKREKAIELFEQGGREDLARKERGEIEVITGFLPAELSEEELRAAVDAAIAEVGATSIRDMGKVMALLKSRPGVNPAQASKLVKERLG